MKPTPQELQASLDAIESELRSIIDFVARLKKQRNSLHFINTHTTNALNHLFELSHKLGC